MRQEVQHHMDLGENHGASIWSAWKRESPEDQRELAKQPAASPWGP